MSYRQHWDLERLLEGRGGSVEKIDEALNEMEKAIHAFDIKAPHLFERYSTLRNRLHEADALVGCMVAMNTHDRDALKLEAKCHTITALFSSLSLSVDQLLVSQTDAAFHALVAENKEIAFPLEERRRLIKEKMSLEKEILVNDLSVCGHAAFTTLYYTLMGEMQFPFEGAHINLSKLEHYFDHADRKKRQEAYQSLEKVLSSHEALFAQILNAIIGYRLTLYKYRGWNDYLHESCTYNRITKKTLEAMWKTVSENKEPLKKFLTRKAKLLGLDRLSYADVGAPLGDPNRANIPSNIPWEEACESIVGAFDRFSPKLALFTKRALTEGWIDVKPSRTKRAGGFCTSLPASRETRIFMTYMNNTHSKTTLAHELGHAYHADALYDRHPLAGDYPMNIAETASTICETIVGEDALTRAKSTEEKISLLDEKISRAVAFLMDLHSRFLFDCAFHEKRATESLAPDTINHLMVEAQREGFADQLSDYIAHFHAYKMHFYFTDISFYNYPYTFGYLFSLGLYTHLMTRHDREDLYIAFLQDTGSMTIEALAKKHLNVDLSTSTFWQSALDLIHKDIDLFLELTNT